MENIPSLRVINDRPDPTVLIQPMNEQEDGFGRGFNRLDLWSDYTIQKNRWVLSAYLGWDLHTRVNHLADLISQWGGGGGVDPDDPDDPTGPGIDWGPIIDDRIQNSAYLWEDAINTNNTIIQAWINDAIPGFTEPSKPITIQTMQLLVGSEGLQFEFVNSKTDPIKKDPQFEYIHAQRKITSTYVTLRHMTLGITDIAPNTNRTYKQWNVAALNLSELEDEKTYFIEAKCKKNDESETAEFILTEMAHDMDWGDGYYYFIVGILNPVRDGNRAYAPLHGFTEILPGRIITGRIRSSDGSTYFDLDQGEIGGNLIITNAGVDTGLNGTTYTSYLQLLAGQIQARVETSHFDTITNQISNSVGELTVRADSIESSVTDIQTILDGIDDKFDDEQVITQWSVNKDGPWHDVYQDGDIYYRQRKVKDGPNNWGPAIKAVATDGTAINIKGSAGSLAELNAQYPFGSGNEVGDGRITQDTGVLYVWDGVEWISAGRIQGPDGRSGRIYIRYASILYETGQTATDIGMSTNPLNKSFMGIQITFDEVASSDPADYQWSKIVGPQGRGIVKIQKQYIAHTSSTVAPSQESLAWSLSYPQFDRTKYLWTRERTLHTEPLDGEIYSYSEPVYNPDWEAINIAYDNASQAIATAEEANINITNLMDNLDDAIKDGIISNSEKEALKNQIFDLLTQKDIVDSEYIVLRDNPKMFEEGSTNTPMRTNLIASYGTYNTRFNNLIDLINNISEDYNSQYKTNIIQAYNLYRSAYASIISSFEAARNFIIDGKLQDAYVVTRSGLLTTSDASTLYATKDTVNEYGQRITDAESRIIVEAGRITNLVEEGGIMSIILQDANSINALAEEINLQASDKFTSLVTKDAFNTEKQDVRSEISQVEDRINLKVSSIEGEVDTVTNEVIMTEWSVDGIHDWHFPPVEGDIYFRQKKIGDTVWGPAVKGTGQDGADGTSVNIQGGVNTVQELPTTANFGDGYIVQATGDLHVYTGAGATGWTNVGKIVGPKGDSQYVYIRYSTASNGNPMSTSPAGRSYMGIQVTSSSTPSSSYDDYTWSKIVGEKGDKGDKGDDGSYKVNRYKKSITQPSLSDAENWSDVPEIPNVKETSVTTWNKLGQMYEAPKLTDNGTTSARVNFTTTVPNQSIFIKIAVVGGDSTDGVVLGALGSSTDPTETNYTHRLYSSVGEGVYEYIVPTPRSTYVNITHFKRSGTGVNTTARLSIIEVNNTWFTQRDSDKTNWSPPIMFVQDNYDSEAIFLRTNILATPIIGENDEDVDDFIPKSYLNDSYKGAFVSNVNYVVGDVVSYQGVDKVKYTADTTRKPPSDNDIWMTLPKWTDNPLGVTKGLPYEYIAERFKEKNKWSDFTEPVIWTQAPQSLERTVREYYVSNSSTELTGSTWGSVVPTPNYDKFLWTRDRQEYINPTEIKYSDPVYNPEWKLIGDVAKDLSEAWVDINANSVSLNAWQGTIDGLNTKVTENEAKLSIYPDEITSFVTDTNLTSKLTQTAGAIEAIAQEINLQGLVKVKEFQSREGLDRITINEYEDPNDEQGDNLMKFRHPNGIVAAKFGMVLKRDSMSEFEPAMIWYDEHGNEIWRAGKDGIKYVISTPEKWTITKLQHINVTESYKPISEHQGVDNTISTALQDALVKCKVDNQTWLQVTQNPPHEYSAGNNSSSEENEKYEGLHTSQLKSTTNWAPNGWYFRQGGVMEDGTNTFIVPLQKYMLGQLVDNITVKVYLPDAALVCTFPKVPQQ